MTQPEPTGDAVSRDAGFEAEFKDARQDIWATGNEAKMRRLFRDFENWVRADERSKVSAAPYVPSDAEVERGALGIEEFIVRAGSRSADAHEYWMHVARAALRAAWGGEAQ